MAQNLTAYRHAAMEGGWGGTPLPQIVVGNSVNCCNHSVNPTCGTNRNTFFILFSHSVILFWTSNLKGLNVSHTCNDTGPE